MAQWLKSRVWSLGQEDSPVEGNCNPFQYSAWRNPWTEETGKLQFMRLHRVRHNWETNTYTHTHTHTHTKTYTSCVHSLFMKYLKGKLEKRSGHLLITYSLFLLLWSIDRTNRLNTLLYDEKIWKGWEWVDHGVPHLRLVIRLRGSCRELFPAKTSFLPKANYKSPVVRESFHFYGIMVEDPFSVSSSWWHEGALFSQWSMSTCSISLLPVVVAHLHMSGRTSYNYFDAHRDMDYYEQ